MIRQHNVLVIEDDFTGGSTLNEVLRTLRGLNKDNNNASKLKIQYTFPYLNHPFVVNISPACPKAK